MARFVERAFDLCERRRPGKALVFIIDEVGQYVARSADKIEDLRAVVEKFGEEGKNRLKARKIVAPAWVIVTSQEKLDEVVAALDSRRVELAKLQDRFKQHIDLAPADIREVAARRVLAKRPEAVDELRRLFREHQGQLNASCALERSSRRSEVGEDDFVQFYPYLPHFIDLSIDIMSGIRLQPGAPRQLGGSNRTIIRQAYEMLVNERTNLANRPVGELVTLDKVFELVEGNLSSEKRKDIDDIAARFKGDREDAGWSVRVAKAVCLLEFVAHLPRTPANIAAVLVDAVDKGRPQAEVEAALARLKEAQFVRETEDGYKLQTAQEKSWETEKRAFDPRPRDRNEIKREVLRQLFAEPQLRTFRYQNLRTFRLGIAVDDARAGDEGDLLLSIRVAEEAAELAEKLEAAVDDSRHASHQNDLYWVMALTLAIDSLIEGLFASQQMSAKYDQLRAQNRITNEESALLAAEKNEESRLRRRLSEAMEGTLRAGTGIFRGVSRDGSSLGGTAGESIRALLQETIPQLYPKLEMGVRPLKGDEAEEVLKAANLNGLSQVFYGGDQGLNLVLQDGSRFIANAEAEIAHEVLGYLRSEHSYGNKVTGKTLEEHFGGIGYGWERDVLRLVLAVLLRAGAIEVTYQGRRFRGHQDPQCRVPLTNNAAFRSASFAPRESVDLRALTTAVERYEELTGAEVDVEEAAIASAIKRFADEETRLLLPLEATARANDLPVLAAIEEYKSNLEAIQRAASDDCVRILAGEGKTLKASQLRIHQIQQALGEDSLVAVRAARLALEQQWPVLEQRGAGGELPAAAEELRSLIGAEDFYTRLDTMSRLAQSIASAYKELYASLHQDRAGQFSGAIEEITNLPEWASVAAEERATILGPLGARACQPEPFLDGAITCGRCGATAGQMESDIAALAGLKSRATSRVEELSAPGEQVERVRVAGFLSGALDSEEAIDQALDELRAHLHKLLAEGIRIVLE